MNLNVNGLTETFYLENYEVEYLIDTPKVNVTLKAGEGLFSNGENEITVTGAPGSKYAELDGYEVPTLTGATYSLQPWYEEYSDEFFDGNRKIFEDVTLVYGFVDSNYSTTPSVMFSFKGKDDENSNGAPVVVNFEYYTDKVQGITYTSFSSIYHTTKNYLTLSSTDSQSYTVWGPIKSISFGNEEGMYSEGNIRVTSIMGVNMLEIKDYAFANLTGLESFNQGAYNKFDYNIGDYAFYNCTSLTNVSLNFAPNTIGKYAFSKTNICSNGDKLNGLLCDAVMVKEGAFSEIPNLAYVVIPVSMDYDEETDTYTINDKTYYYTNWDENWGGTSGTIPEIIVLMNDVTEINKKIVLTSKDYALETLCVILYPDTSKYYVQINLEADNSSWISFRILGSNTSYMNATGTTVVTQDSFRYLSDNNYDYFAFNIINNFTDEQKVTLTIGKLAG